MTTDDYLMTKSRSGKFCTNCGSPLYAGENFCAECGAPVREQSAGKKNRTAAAAGIAADPVYDKAADKKADKKAAKKNKKQAKKATRNQKSEMNTALILRSIPMPAGSVILHTA